MFSNDEYIVLATEHGWIKKTPLKAFENLTSRGLTIASLDQGDSLNWCHKCTDSNDILIGSAMGMATRFKADKLRPTGRTSRGVRTMKLKDGDTVAGMNVLDASIDEKSDKSSEYVLALTAHGYGKRVPTTEFRAQARGGSGVIAIKFKNSSKDDYMSCLRVVREDDEILVITAKGIMVRQRVGDIPSQGRAATGVMVQKVDVRGGDHISSVSLVPKYEETDE
jgi:DNA gyrase subunit A